MNSFDDSLGGAAKTEYAPVTLSVRDSQFYSNTLQTDDVMRVGCLRYSCPEILSSRSDHALCRS